MHSQKPAAFPILIQDLVAKLTASARFCGFKRQFLSVSNEKSLTRLTRSNPPDRN
jgi:hypothetical protein